MKRRVFLRLRQRRVRKIFWDLEQWTSTAPVWLSTTYAISTGLDLKWLCLNHACCCKICVWITRGSKSSLCLNFYIIILYLCIVKYKNHIVRKAVTSFSFIFTYSCLVLTKELQCQKGFVYYLYFSLMVFRNIVI